MSRLLRRAGSGSRITSRSIKSSTESDSISKNRIVSSHIEEIKNNGGLDELQNPEVEKMLSGLEDEDAILVDDIDFTSSNSEKVVTKSKEAEIKKRKYDTLKRKQAEHEERINVSAKNIKEVNVETKKLAKFIDEYILMLRSIAEESGDNPQLLRKLEVLRRTCVGFVNALDRQLPSYATSLFVNSNMED